MLQDMRGKRNTEVEMFAEVVSRLALGKKHKLPTPVNHILYQLIKAKEKVSYLCFSKAPLGFII